MGLGFWSVRIWGFRVSRCQTFVGFCVKDAERGELVI